MYIDEGFTCDTANTLHNLGAGDLIKAIKKRDISIEVLYKLTKEDFIRLGASEEQAEYLISNLIDEEQNIPLISEPKLRSFIQILKQGQEQLSLLHAFLVYCNVRLEQGKINLIVDGNKNIHASKILCDASEAICSQTQSIEQAVKELEVPGKITKASKGEGKPECTCKRLYIVASGISLAICTVLYMFKTKPNFSIFLKH